MAGDVFKKNPIVSLILLAVLSVTALSESEVLAFAAVPPATGGERKTLANRFLALTFDPGSGSLVSVQNRLTGETYSVSDDTFAVSAEDFHIEQPAAKLVSVQQKAESWTARYEAGPLRIEVIYTLAAKHMFAGKRMTLRCGRDSRLKKVVVSRPVFTAPDLHLVHYRYPQFGRPPGTEPISTFFGRTPRGGFCAGLELPFAASALAGRQIVLAYAPSLKVKAGEEFACEPMYVGVYRRTPLDETPPAVPPIRGPGLKTPAGAPEVLPLPSESAAMVAMTSAILGPPRHGLVPMACGWHCEMEQQAFPSDAAVEADMQSLDFLTQCGIDWLSSSHPWEGETEKMNALGENDHYQPGSRVRRFLEQARKAGVRIVMWPTMNHTHPWSGAGRPFRPDQPQWLMTLSTLEGRPDVIKKRAGRANCLANTPFFQWLTRINAESLATGYFDAWAMDGSFFGDGGWFTTIIPVDCASAAHDHLPGDSNYACQRALERLSADVRRRYPHMYIFMCRPPMDLGVWSLRQVDACFTLLESGTGRSNLAAGDEIRTWSRVRVQHHFFPHYLDQPLLFPSRAARKAPPNWPRGKIDYIMLSALSCSPNQLYYLPTKTGIPEADKAEIRKWLAWGRKNIAFLQVRRDLPAWPGPGQVDGSAHIRGEQGLVFLFNPNRQPLAAGFQLDEPSLGLTSEGRYAIRQEYPPAGRRIEAKYGARVAWQVPPESALVLCVEKIAE